MDIIVEDDIRNVGGKGLLSDTLDAARRVVSVDPSALAERFNSLCLDLDGMLQHVSGSVGAFSLHSFEVQIELTAKGELRLIGCVGSEAKGGLKLTFQRRVDVP